MTNALIRMAVLGLLLAGACGVEPVAELQQEGKKNPDAGAIPGCPATLDCNLVPPPPNEGWSLGGSWYCDMDSNGGQIGYMMCAWTRPSYPWGPLTTTYTQIGAPDGCEACMQVSGATGPACARTAQGLPQYLAGNQVWTCNQN